MHKKMKKIYRNWLLLILLFITVFILGAVPGRALAKEQGKPYLIKVNRVYNTITVYSKDDDGKYTVPVKAMLCSVGTNGRTTAGTFQTKQKYRWKVLMGNVWGQYSTRIVKGILFHSVYYYNKNPDSLANSEYNKLGTAASHGCIRLAVKDAKWIYDNCSIGTTVVIYDNKKSPGPLGKPEGVKIASSVRWDPTDPDTDNPYLDKKPVITGVNNCKTVWGETYKPLNGVKATSSVGTDISSKVSVTGKVHPLTPGDYKLTYSVTDSLNKTVKKVITVTVKNNTVAPVFKGITDKVIKTGVTVNEKFALSGVQAYCKGYKLGKGLIRVSVNKSGDTGYDITYKASIGNGPITTKKSRITIDSEAPVITGLEDIILQEEELPTKEMVKAYLSVSDNYTEEDKIKLTIKITEQSEGCYLITCKASDEAGNVKVEQVSVKWPEQEPTEAPTPSTAPPAQ